MGAAHPKPPASATLTDAGSGGFQTRPFGVGAALVAALVIGGAGAREGRP